MIAWTWVLDVPRGTRLDGVAARTGEALGESEGLLAGLVAVAEAGVEDAPQTALALVSVWANGSRLNAFVWGDAMASLERDLARPSGRLWSVTSVQRDRERLLKATHAGLAVSAPMTAPLAERVDAHRGEVGRALAGRSTALACRGLDPHTWDEASIDAWTGRPRAYAGRVFSVVRAAAAERS